MIFAPFHFSASGISLLSSPSVFDFPFVLEILLFELNCDDLCLLIVFTEKCVNQSIRRGSFLCMFVISARSLIFLFEFLDKVLLCMFQNFLILLPQHR